MINATCINNRNCGSISSRTFWTSLATCNSKLHVCLQATIPPVTFSSYRRKLCSQTINFCWLSSQVMFALKMLSFLRMNKNVEKWHFDWEKQQILIPSTSLAFARTISHLYCTYWYGSNMFFYDIRVIFLNVYVRYGIWCTWVNARNGIVQMEGID